MSWYGGWEAFPRYVPVAERRMQAARARAALAGRRGRPAEPVVLERRAIATTFWGRAWCDNLGRYMDFVNRLPRGRSYVRSGAVVDLLIAPGAVRALVAGTALYTVTVGIAPLSRARWQRVLARCTGRIASLVALLRGELSSDVLAALVDPREGLFPEPRDMTMQCSCPDWAQMCKHVAAVLYGVGVRLDTAPELFFTLRRVDQADLVTRATSGALARGGGTGSKRVAAGKLADVFGIELDDSGPGPAAAVQSTAPSTRRGKPVRSTAPSRAGGARSRTRRGASSRDGRRGPSARPRP